jgi:hypothetical protein
VHARPRAVDGGTRVFDNRIRFGRPDGIRCEKRNQPILDLLQRRRVDAVVAVLAPLPHGDQADIAQHLEVFGDSGLADVQLGDDLPHADPAAVEIGRKVLLEEYSQQFAPGWIRNHVKDVSHENRVAGRAGEYHDMLSCTCHTSEG